MLEKLISKTLRILDLKKNPRNEYTFIELKGLLREQMESNVHVIPPINKSKILCTYSNIKPVKPKQKYFREIC